MNYEEFNNIFKKQVATLTNAKQLEFGLTICKELFFDYQKFSEINQWGDPDLLMDAIKMCGHAVDGIMNTSQVKEMIIRIDSIIPDTDEFGNEIGSYGLNASLAVYETLQFLIDNDQIHIYNIGTYYFDTNYIRVQEDMEMPTKDIDRHPMMIKAKTFLLEKTN
jgi:hypothetical protein